MPRKRTYRRYKRKKGGKSLQAQINMLKKQARDTKPQLKFTDTTGTSADIYSTPTIVFCSTGAQGPLRIKSIQLKGHLELDSATSTVEYYRVVIFTDKSNEGGSPPTWSDVYDSPTGDAAVNALREIDDAKNEGTRFRVLYDRKFNLIKDTISHSDVRDQVFFDFYKKLNIKSILAATYWEKGGIYLAFVGTSATGVCDFNYKVRLRYTENSD